MAATDAIAAQFQGQLERALQEHERVALCYSGGLESSLMLHLATPSRERLMVYSLRTGAEFPHMLEFKDKSLAGWNARIVRSDIARSFENVGIPASVVAIDHSPLFGPIFGRVQQPQIIDWPSCCFLNRNMPLVDAVVADGVTVALLGQTADDFLGQRAQPTTGRGAQIQYINPLWGFTREETRQACADLGVELPSHYAENADSLDCSICPAFLTPERRAWMVRHYPAELDRAEAFQVRVAQIVGSALRGETTFPRHRVLTAQSEDTVN